MPSRIVFAAGGSDLTVKEDVVAVFDALNEAHGVPTRLTAEDGTVVYVNPTTITYWKPEERAGG